MVIRLCRSYINSELCFGGVESRCYTRLCRRKFAGGAACVTSPTGKYRVWKECGRVDMVRINSNAWRNQNFFDVLSKVMKVIFRGRRGTWLI